MSATIDLEGPSTQPGAPPITPTAINVAVNAAFATTGASVAAAAAAAAAAGTTANAAQTAATAALPKAGGTLTGAVTSTATGIAISATGTGSIKMPVGTTAQRQTGVNGEIRFNSTIGQPEVGTGSTYLPVAKGVARPINIAALRSYDITGLSTNGCIAIVDRYAAVAGVGGGTFDWDTASLLFDDAVIVIRPNSITSGNPGRWRRRLESGYLTPEMAGAVGDYVFPTLNSGENYGTDNAAAFQTLATAAGFAANNGYPGSTIRLSPKNYLIAGSVNVPSGVNIVGSGYDGGAGTFSGSLANLFQVGSVLVVDPFPSAANASAAGLITIAGRNSLSGFRVMRRGLDLTPLTADVVTLFQTTLPNELTLNRQWAPNTAYNVGDFAVNLANVYKCTTAGTSDATAFGGGPLAQTSLSNSITDGSARWKFVNELQWVPGIAYTSAMVGSMVTNSNHIYQLDSAGTSGATGPINTTATVGGITDGSVTWHYIGAFSVGLRCDATAVKIEKMTIVGFAKGIYSHGGVDATKCYLDCLIGLDMYGIADTAYVRDVKCTPLYQPAADTPPDNKWRRKQQMGFHIHDQCDSVIIDGCSSEAWAIGMRLSNVWGANFSKCRSETNGGNAFFGDASYQLRNVCSYVEFEGCYGDGMYTYDIGCTDNSHAAVLNSITQTTSDVLIRGGQVATYPSGQYSGPGTPTHFVISGNAHGTIIAPHINRQGQVPFVFNATNGGEVFWKISDVMIDEATGNPTQKDVATIDSTAAGFVHFNGIWHANGNREIYPTGFDDSADIVASPSSAGSHTVLDAATWCHLAASGTLSSYTITMPPDPPDQRDVLISCAAAITTLTISPNTSLHAQTIDAAPTSLAAHGAVRFRYLQSSTKWIRLIAS